MSIHNGLLIFGAVVLTICTIVSFNVPWATVNIPVKQGPLSMKVPVRIGLTKCFDEICEKQDGIENFLHIEVPTLSPSRSPSRFPTQSPEPSVSPSADPTISNTADSLLQSSRSWLPKNVKNTLDGTLKDERKVVGRYLHPFKLASVVSIPTILLSTVCSTYVLFVFGCRLSFFIVGIHRTPALSTVTLCTLLLSGAGLLSLSSLIYALITCFYLNGGEYCQGIALPVFAGVAGGMCALHARHEERNTRELSRDSGYLPISSENDHSVTVEMTENKVYNGYGSTHPS